MRVIIAGSRDFNDYELLKKHCDCLLQNQKEVEIVSGGARGADKLGERYASEKGYPLKKFPADWEKFGKSAGYKRNKEMAEYADSLIVFWDGISKGTKNMIGLASGRGLGVRVINIC
jgi:hypothetical protein